MLIVAPKRSSAEEQNEPLPLTSQVDFIARNHISLQQHHCFCGRGEKTRQPGGGGEGGALPMRKMALEADWP